MNQLIRLFLRITAILFFLTLISSPELLFAGDGETLFKANCASCHKPLDAYVGPALKGAREREPSKDWVYKWVPNTTVMVNTDPYAMQLKGQFGNVVMTSFPDLKKEDIDAVKDPHNWILQRKVKYADVIQTPDIPAKAEIRIFYFWKDGAARPVATNNLARLSKGKMIGGRYNMDKDWVGGSVAYFEK